MLSSFCDGVCNTLINLQKIVKAIFENKKKNKFWQLSGVWNAEIIAENYKFYVRWQL